MKKSVKLILSSLILVSLTGCPLNITYSPNNGGNNSTNSSKDSSSLSNNQSSSSTSIITNSNNSSTSSNNSSTSFDNKEIILDLYASNDIHGRISENINEDEPGIAKLATYLNNRKNENKDGYIYLNSGDYWQDTYESGYNKGKLLTECLNLMECEILALGNHEFDWGIDVIRENKQLTTYTTFLGANIRQYPDTSKQVDFAEPYKIIERQGLKIGIIGAIGRNQITSITSSNWENITFLDHTQVVKDISDDLRVNKGCDVIILSIHADESDSNGSSITQVSSKSNKKYVDAVFCAHSHQREVKYYNNVPFIQAGDHGTNLSHIKLKYNNGNVTAMNAEYIGYREMSNLEADTEINAVIDKYFTSTFINDRDRVHGTITGYTMDKIIAGNLLAKATYDLLKENNINCDIVINNGSRPYENPIGDMTSEMLFNIMPFTNKTLVVENISGEDILKECQYYDNPYYMPNPNLEITSDGKYTVACIDYMMIHKNADRYYDYFKTYNANNLVYTVTDYPNVILENYLAKNKTISTYDYSGTNYNCL